MSGPLTGIKVVDFSGVVSGPLAAMWLSDQGADVVKIEAPGLGDITRGRFGPGHHGLAGLFVNCNRGKRSLAVDVTTDEGLGIIRALMKQADVVIQNWRPGVVDRLGVGYDTVAAENPSVIYASISGFGPDGPYAQRRVYDPIIQGLSGHVAAQVNPSLPIPDLVRTIVCDKATALVAAQAITAALFARERGAGGQHLVIPMLDAAIAFAFPDTWMRDAMLDCEFSPQSTTLSEVYSLTATADGHLVYYCANDQEMHGVFRAVGHPEWCEDIRFAHLPDRRRHRDELGALLADAFAEFANAEIYQRMLHEDVPVGLVLSLDQVPEDPQVRHNEVMDIAHHPAVGRVREARHPVRFSATPVDRKPVAPMLGAHTNEILAELGWSIDDVADLKDRHIVQ